MIKILELSIVITVLGFIVYTLSYFLLFNNLCWNYSWDENMEKLESVYVLAKCKDTIICEAVNINFTDSNKDNTWECTKKASPIFGKDLYLNLFNSLKTEIYNGQN